jgi:Protein of unknown function (DUF2752)
MLLNRKTIFLNEQNKVRRSPSGLARHSLFPEALAWMIALAIPAFINPHAETHFSLCFFDNIGLSWCPGCGLGRSIALLYRGELTASFQAHPLGMFAVIILLYRIVTIVFRKNKPNPLQHECRQHQSPADRHDIAT